MRSPSLASGSLNLTHKGVLVRNFATGCPSSLKGPTVLPLMQLRLCTD
jgi:hypothetical protein